MTWGIIGALDTEVRLILEHMTVEETKETMNSTFYKGRIGNQEVALVCCGIGKINAAVCADVVIREMGADCIVNIGIAGNLSPELGIMDVVVSDMVQFHDIPLDLYETFYPFQRGFAANVALIRACTDAIERQPNRSYDYRVGKVVTGDAFVDSSALKEDIVARLSPLCTEMEGAAIAQVAFMNDTPFLVVRTISDNADDEAGETYDNFFDVAAQNSSSILLDMISHYATNPFTF